MSVCALPDKTSANEKVWNIFHLSYNKIISQLFPYNTFKWVYAHGTNEKSHETKKTVCFHSRGRFLGHFIEFVRFSKNDSCAEMGLRVLKMVPSQLSWWIQIRRLENPHKRHFIRLGNFNKITEKLALLRICRQELEWGYEGCSASGDSWKLPEKGSKLFAHKN